MKLLCIRFILVASFSALIIPLSFAQTPEQLSQEADERKEAVTPRKRLNWLAGKQSKLDRIHTAFSREHSPADSFSGEADSTKNHLISGEAVPDNLSTVPFLSNSLQFLKKAGNSTIKGGILTIILIYVLLMIIIYLRISNSNKRQWQYLL